MRRVPYLRMDRAPSSDRVRIWFMSTLPEGDREWSWAASADAVQEHQSHARRLVGSRIIGITYIDLDYTGFNHEDRTYGPRPVVDELEWAEANWAMPMCDSVEVKSATVVYERVTDSREASRFARSIREK